MQLQARMVSSIPGFKKSAMECKHKLNTLYKQYREDKVANNILGNDRHDCKFYKSLTPKGLGNPYVGFSDSGQSAVNAFYF
jgi:hypothetical protein